MLKQRALSRQGNGYRNTAIVSADRHGTIIKHGFDKGLQLSGEALGVAFHKEVKGEIAPHAAVIADHRRIGIGIIDGDAAITAKQLDALVIAIAGAAAIADGRDGPTGKTEHYSSVGNVPSQGNLRLIQAMSEGEDLFD